MARDAASARVVVSRLDGNAVVSVSDRGPALDDVARARLLHAPQIPPPDQGLGLRLLIAKAIVEGHGGSIDVDATADATLRVRCTLPLA
jgi:C4-dicarboxylate-specific signal transduction histidine kinase